MGFSVVCHGCGQILYDGEDMIPIYRLKNELDGKCPSCQRKLALKPINITFGKVDLRKDVSSIK